MRILISLYIYGISGSQCSHSSSRNGYSCSDSRNPHSSRYSHSRTTSPQYLLNLLLFSIFQITQNFALRVPHFAVFSKTAQAEAKGRKRDRGTATRVQRAETRSRPVSRTRAQQAPKPAIRRTLIVYNGIEVVAISC